MSLKKKSKTRGVSAPKHPAPDIIDVDPTVPGDPDTPAPRPGLVPAKKADVSAAFVVEPNAVDEDDKDSREEKVMATRKGYYGHKVRVPGEIFIMHFKGKKGFLPSWVRLAEEEDIPMRTVETKTTTKEVEVLNNSRPYSEGGNTVPSDAGRTVI